MAVTLEGMAQSVGLFAAYFSLYEAYLVYFRPRGPEVFEEELGPFYQWFWDQNKDTLGAFVGSLHNEPTSTTEKAQWIAALQVLGAVVTIFTSQKILGLAGLSWYYMSAVRGHVTLQTQYMRVVMTMFGFTHVSLLTYLLGGLGLTTSTSKEETLEQSLASADKAKTEESTDADADESSASKNNKSATTSSKSSSNKKKKGKKKSS